MSMVKPLMILLEKRKHYDFIDSLLDSILPTQELLYINTASGKVFIRTSENTDEFQAVLSFNSPEDIYARALEHIGSGSKRQWVVLYDAYDNRHNLISKFSTAGIPVAVIVADIPISPKTRFDCIDLTGDTKNFVHITNAGYVTGSTETGVGRCAKLLVIQDTRLAFPFESFRTTIEEMTAAKNTCSYVINGDSGNCIDVNSDPRRNVDFDGLVAAIEEIDDGMRSAFLVHKYTQHTAMRVRELLQLNVDMLYVTDELSDVANLSLEFDTVLVNKDGRESTIHYTSTTGWYSDKQKQ